MKVKSQTKDVLLYMVNNGSITSMTAWGKFRITRLADVIFKLRKRGYDIVTDIKRGVGEYGAYDYAEYRLVGVGNAVVSGEVQTTDV